jgi:REP element-mobilizing transposase RayT
MEALASVFGCDVLSYAVMSNHLHIILRNRPDVVSQWTDEEVAIRWLRVFPGKRLDEHLGDPTDQDVQALCSAPERLSEVRRRLSDISWFMRALSEPIARLANKQDECTGRFWEGRFKAQRITDEAGLLACAMYVDLNPVRAAMAESPDEAQHTSAYDRIHGEQGQEIDSAALELKAVSREASAGSLRATPVSELKRQRAAKRQRGTGKRIRRDAWLSPLTLARSSTADKPQVHRSGVRASDKGFLGLKVQEYLDLLRWTARQGPTAGAQGSEIPTGLGEAVSRLGIDLKMWCDLVWNYRQYFGRSSCAGSPGSMCEHARKQGHRWVQGQAAAAECFTT